jgi:hypothetical protein
MIRDYEILPETDNGHQLIKLTSGQYSGIIYTYGAVSFEEGTEGNAVLKFDYAIHWSCEDLIKDMDMTDFPTVIGNNLVDLITEQLARNEIVYTGGIDENRATDSEQSDS